MWVVPLAECAELRAGLLLAALVIDQQR